MCVQVQQSCRDEATHPSRIPFTFLRLPPFSATHFCHLHLPRCSRRSTFFFIFPPFPLSLYLILFLFLHPPTSATFTCFIDAHAFQTLHYCFLPFPYSSIFSLGFLLMIMVVLMIVYSYGDHRFRCDAFDQYSQASFTLTMMLMTMVVVMVIVKITMIVTMMVMMIGEDHIVPCDAFHRHSWASLTDGRPNTSHSHRPGIPKGEKECVTRAPLIFSSTLLFISQSPKHYLCVSTY